MLRRKLAISVALALLLCSGLADAEKAEFDYAASGPYLHAAVIQTFERFVEPVSGGRVGFDIAMGARFWRYAAAELEFQAVPNWNLRGIEQSTYGITANVKGYLPVGRFQPFLLAGLGTLITEPDSRVGHTSTARFAYRLGGGVDVFVWKERALVSLSYGYTGNFDGYGYTALYWTIGYHFAGD